MTKPEILRQIDAEVAAVLGWQCRRCKDGKYRRYGDHEWHRMGYGGYPDWQEEQPRFDCDHYEHYTTDANAAEEVERWALSYEGKDAKAEIRYEYKDKTWWCWIRVWKRWDGHEYAVLCAPRCERHPGAATRILALCLAILPEERREYYSKMLRECEG